MLKGVWKSFKLLLGGGESVKGIVVSIYNRECVFVVGEERTV